MYLFKKNLSICMYVIGIGNESIDHVPMQVPAVVSEAISNAGLSVSDVDWLLLHQANIRIMEHAAEVLGISMDKVLRNIEVCWPCA